MTINPLHPAEIKPARVTSDGIALIGFASLMEAIFGADWWKQGTVKCHQKSALWLKSFGVMLYARTGDKFDLAEAVALARDGGYKYVLLEGI